MQGALFDATIYLGATVLAVPLAARAGLGSVLGYLLAGLAIGPVLGLVGTETEDLRHYAEFGVVMMLFLIGLEMAPRTLWDMRHKLIGLGGLQIVASTGLVMGVGLAMGADWAMALAVGLVLAPSSTAIVVQTLNEKGLMKRPGGRASFSVLLTQDMAVIPMLALIPLLAPDTAQEGGGAHGGLSLIDGLPGWQQALVTLGALLAVVGLVLYGTRPVYRFVQMAKLRELRTAMALLLIIAIAFAMTLIGLSPALGAFVAGVVLAGSDLRHDLEANIEPFKGLLLGLFFITVGAGIDPGILAADPGLIALLTLGLMLGKGVILYLLALLFRIRGRDRWLFTLGLAQAGEFGFVLIGFAVAEGVVVELYGQILLLVVALSMLLTPLAFIAYDLLSRRLAEPRPAGEPEAVETSGRVIIAGIGRFGQVVNRMLHVAGIPTVLLDHDLATIELMRKYGFQAILGDPTRTELLHAAGLDEARVLVVTLDDRDGVLRLVRQARSVRPDLHIIARAHDRLHVYELHHAGANDIIREMFDSSLRAGRYVLENMDFSDYEANALEKAFYRHDRYALRELAQLWRPDVPIDDNAAFLARARELDRDLETALVQLAAEESTPSEGAGPPRREVG